MKKRKTSKLDIVIILFLMIIGTLLRTYRLDQPIADWHSWRQSDTASVSWEYVRNGIDLLHPKYQDLSYTPSGQENPEGWRFVEFPVINALHAKLFTTYPNIDFVVWGRLLTITASIMTIGVLYILTQSLAGRTTAVFTAGLFSVLPYNIFYGRVILPEPFVVLFAFSALHLFLCWLESRRWITYIIGTLLFILALLMKPTALVILLPIAFVAWSKRAEFSLKDKILLAGIPIVSLAPLVWWRLWMQQFPEGIPFSKWLFNGNGIRFKGAFFRWIFGDRIARLILGYWGIVIVAIGSMNLNLKRTSGKVFSGIILGSLSYLIILATGNVQHDYYQIQIIPSISILYGLGATWLLDRKKGWAKIQPLALIGVSTLLMLSLGWYEIRGYFNINNPAIVEAGRKTDELIPPNDLIIAPYNTDTAFLFQTRRRGWPVGGDIEDKILQGAKYYVTTARNDEYEQLKQIYPVIYEEDTYSIIKLETK